jgi:hypothetical protein
MTTAQKASLLVVALYALFAPGVLALVAIRLSERKSIDAAELLRGQVPETPERRLGRRGPPL